MIWLKKLGFLFLWTFSHGVSGAAALILAESAVRANPSSRFASTLGLVVFEGVILFSKELVFRRFQGIRLAHSIDIFAWIMAGMILIVARWLGDPPYDEEFTPISLSLLRFSIFFAISVALITYIPRLFRSLKQKNDNWRTRFESRFPDQPFLERLKYPIYISRGLFFFLLLYVVLAIYFLGLFFLSLAPVEYFKMEFESWLWPMKTIWFGLSSVGYAGFITGVFYLLLYPSDKTILDFFAVDRMQR